MKKALLGILSAAIALSMLTATTFAAGPGGRRCFADGGGVRGNYGFGRGCGYGHGGNFVDADGDGVCDNAGSGCAYADADGDGVCDNYGSGRGCGYGRGAQGGRGR